MTQRLLTRTSALLAAVVACGMLAAREKALPQSRPIRVLFVLGGPPVHDIVKLPPILEKQLQEHGGFQVTRLQPPPGHPTDAAHLARLAQTTPRDADVLLFYTTGYSLNPEPERALEAFVNDGGGIVALHGASASFGNSQVWQRLIGAKFSGHAAGLFPLELEIVDRQNPITRGIRDFRTMDEEYHHTFVPGAERHALARFKERPPQSINPQDNRDVAWTREIGKGRVFYNALGHDDKSWTNPEWQRMVIQGLVWAAHRS
jgi:uncharacterized protein